MAILERDSFRRKLDAAGAEKVRKRLETGAYASHKISIVQAWLDGQAVEVKAGIAEKARPLADRYTEKLKNHPIVAILVVATTVLIGVAKFTDAVTKLANIVPGIFKPAVVLPPIPGDSGWILVGDLDPGGTRYVRGPLYEIDKSSYLEKSLTPRKGEQIRLNAERNIIIAGYKSTGLAKQFMPPWQLNVLSDNDYTGVKLPKNAVVEVRDIGLGNFPAQPILVWVRVAPPPK